MSRRYRIVPLLCMLCICTSSVTGKSSNSSNFSFDIGKDGSFKVSVSGRTWLQSGSTWFRMNNKTVSTADHSLKLTHTDTVMGHDNIGTYKFKTLYYKAGDMGFQAIYVTYPDYPELVILGQLYEQNTYGTSMHDKQKVVSGFPTFKLTDTTDYVGYFSPRGYFTGFASPVFSRWTNSSIEFDDGYKAGPIAFYDEKSRDTIVMSHFNNFMAASYWYDNSTQQFNVGIQGRAERVPANYVVYTIFYYSNEGINQAFTGWGSMLKAYWNSKNDDYVKTDFVQNYLGYWTDNGAYYYYNPLPNKTYEDTILAIYEYSQEAGLPYRYFQYDSWFYPKNVNDSGMLGWYPIQSEFPHSVNYIQKKTGWLAAVHQRYWSPKTPMAKQNGGNYDFYLDKSYALPLEDMLWEDVLNNSTFYGTKNLVMDWLGQMYEHIDLLQTNVTIGTQYLHHMSHAAQLNGLTIEYCTSYPRHNLAALQLPTVTFTRASEDYTAGNDQWKLGHTSMWLYAIGQIPFKDNYWSTSHQNCSKYPGKREPYPELESLVSSLTAGPVAIGDGVGKSNTTLIMRCCDADGLILKPDRPATSLDEYFIKRSFGNSKVGEAWSTYSVVSGYFHGIIFGADFSAESSSYTITPLSAGFSNQMQTLGKQSYYVFSYQTPWKLMPFNEHKPLYLENCTKTDYCLYYVSPVIQLTDRITVVILGELNKWIPISSNRILQLEPRGSDVSLMIQGGIGEKVSISAMVSGEYKVITCLINQNRLTVLNVISASCD